MTLSTRNMLLSFASLAAILGTTAGFARAAADASATAGVVSHINLVSDKSEDVSTMEAWKKTYIKDGMSDQDKAIAIWRFMVRYRHQDNPPNEGLEGTPVPAWNGEKVKGEGNVHEPFKTIHVYGYGMCCCVAADIEGLSRYIGLPARGRVINNHSVPEVWYHDSWHLFDASLCFFIQKPGADGTPATGDVASVDEMKADIGAWKKNHPEVGDDAARMKFQKDEGWLKGPTLFATVNLSPTAQALHGFYSKDGWCRAEAPTANGTTNHGWNSNMVEYNYKVVDGKDDKPIKTITPPDTKEEVNVTDYQPIMGYELNVQLREGEKITRNWNAKEVATGLNQKNEKRFAKFLAGDMQAFSLQQELGDKNPGRIGNGQLEYDALADSKLSVDAIQCENLTVADGKIRITDGSKPATLVVRVPSSYLYLSGDMTAKPVVGAGGSVTASISVNNGLDWKQLGKYEQSGDQKADLKPTIFNKYDYRVKFDIAGAGSGLDGLKLSEVFQHSQAPLPVITEGDNKINFSAGAQEGTITVEGNMNGPGAALSIGDFHPVIDGLNDKKFMGNGSAIIPVTCPGEVTRVRLGVAWRARDAADGYTISVSSDEGKTWKEMGKLEMTSQSSTYLTFSDIPAGTKAVQVKFDAKQKNTTCIFGLRVDVDYKEPVGGFRPVKITYNWEEPAVAPAAPAAAPAPAAPTTAPAPADDKPAKGAKGAAKGAKKGPAPVAEKPAALVKTDVHVCTNPNESWTIKCGPGTVAKSYTVELVK